MAGIKNALKRVADGRNRGTVIATGRTDDASYIIVELNHDKGHITEYDYGNDLRISEHVCKGDNVILMIRDNWTAEWVREQDMCKMGVPNITLDIVPDGCSSRYDMGYANTDAPIVSHDCHGVVGKSVKSLISNGDLVVPTYPLDKAPITEMVKRAMDSDLDEVVISIKGDEVGVWAFRGKKEKKKFHMTPEMYAELLQRKAGRKVVFESGEKFRIGTFISHSQKYNSSYYIAFDRDGDVDYAHVHDGNVIFFPSDDTVAEMIGRNVIAGSGKALKMHFSFVKESAANALEIGDCYWGEDDLASQYAKVAHVVLDVAIEVTYMEKTRDGAVARRVLAAFA